MQKEQIRAIVAKYRKLESSPVHTIEKKRAIMDVSLII
jgi:hypothetical protein